MRRLHPGSALLAIALACAAPATAQQTHLVTVVGLGGAPEYTEEFTGWAMTLRTNAMERYRIPAGQITTLAEETGIEGVDGESRADQVRATVADLATRAGPNDRILFVLIGHGTLRGDDVFLNLPGPDLSANDWGELLNQLGSRSVALVNVASASGPFVEALSGPNRIIVTATRSARERNETQFGRYFAEAFGGEAADLDKDGALSLLEAYQWARSETVRYYEEEGLLATEHSILDDDGDGEGTEEPSQDTTDGLLASGFLFATATSDLNADLPSDSTTVRLIQERAQIEARLAELRGMRATMDPTEYDTLLEELLIELALKNREIEARGGGGA